MTRTLFFLLFFCNEFPCCFAQPDWIAREAAFKEYCQRAAYLSPIEGIWVLHTEIILFDSLSNPIYNFKYSEFSKMIIRREGKDYWVNDSSLDLGDGFDFVLRKSPFSGNFYAGSRPRHGNNGRRIRLHLQADRLISGFPAYDEKELRELIGGLCSTDHKLKTELHWVKEYPPLDFTNEKFK
jgi:hypothetical protein